MVEEPEAFLEAEPKVAIYVARILARRLNAVNHLLVDARRRVDETEQRAGSCSTPSTASADALQIRVPR